MPASRPRELGLLAASSPQALADLHTLIAASELTALAIETDTRHGYKPRLALVSLAISGRSENALATFDSLERDPKDRGPLEALYRALTHTRLLVHGGEHTFALMRRQLGLRFPNVVDTQQAALLLGVPRTGLRALVAELLGADLPPVRSVDWAARPLDPADLAAALADVTYLPALWRALATRIADADLEDELAVASRLVEDPPLPPLARIDNLPDPKRFRHIDGASQLAPEGLAVLATLTRWRDQKARELDLPPLAIFSNAQLVDLATSPEHALQRLAQVRFHSRLVHADQQSLRFAIMAAMSGPPETSRHTHSAKGTFVKGKPDAATRNRLAKLKAFRRDEAARRQVGLMAILPAVALEHLAFFPETPFSDVPGLGARRTARYGDTLTSLIRD